MNMMKMVNVIAKLQVAKNHQNKFGGYNYRNAEDILAGLKPLMLEYGVVVLISDTIEMVGDRYYVKATVRVYDTEDGSLLAENAAYAREAAMKKGMDEAQITGSASSYARKYALAGMFNLSPAADPDELEPAKEEKKHVVERKFPIEKVVEVLARHNIDAGDFARLVCKAPSIAEVPPKVADAIVMDTERAVNKYLALDQARPQGA
nr:MAG TPA: ERF superfamily protein [Caudoviricetes sp.]